MTGHRAQFSPPDWRRVGEHVALARDLLESVAKLHPRLSPPGTQHTLTIEEPPADARSGEQLTLI